MDAVPNMLNADDPQSALAVRMLAKTAADRTKPIVFWIGAGASRWLSYPSWAELARHVRKVFAQTVVGFDNERAVDLIYQEQFPAFFEACRNLDRNTYFKTIADAFLPKERTATYQSFTDLLLEINPLYVLTTNVDEALETALPGSASVQKTDLSRCVDLLGAEVPFIAKLHGSVSSIRSTVFTASDYQELTNDISYMASLKHIFTSCTVVFLGYGLRDSYVVELLHENVRERDLFGAGPHFAVTNAQVPAISIRPIRYSLRISPDHSAALTVLRVIVQSVGLKEPAVATHRVDRAPEGVERQTVPLGKTAYYVSDLIPPGTSLTSQEISAKGEMSEIEASFGLGFTNEEFHLRFLVSTAMHDLVVGLLCFDYVYLPLTAVGNLIRLVGETLARKLIENDTLRFIQSETQLGIIFAKGGVMGSVGNITLNVAPGSGAPAPLSSYIRKLLIPASGKEKEADTLFELIEKRTSIYKRGIEVNLPSLVRGALLMPKVPALLGIGDAIAPTQVPRWLRYPYLRLAHLVETGTFCAEFGIQAAKVPFGGPQLTSAAFGVQRADIYAENLASYVSSNRNFNSDLGALIHQNPSILQNILLFRASADGESFRRETAAVLATGTGREFGASVNAGLSRTIPLSVLQRAHDRMLTLMTESAKVVPVPAVWGNVQHDDSVTRLWRVKSEKLLLEICRSQGVGKNDDCVCGSGEKLRLCCLAPLRR